MTSPKKEFGINIKDKFQDFFSRMEAETFSHMKHGTDFLCGNYELETIQMFKESFNKLVLLPKEEFENNT